MFTTERDLSEVEGLIGKFRHALEDLTIPGGAERLQKVYAAYETGEREAYFEARSVEGAMRTVIAVSDLLETYDRIFLEIGDLNRLMASVDVETAAVREQLRTEYVEALVDGGLDNVNLFKYRDMCADINEVRLGLQ